ncbi:charged multivesicular body protein 7 isoform 2-T2 [Spinachia spinachia]
MSNAADGAFPAEWDDDERMNVMFSDFNENREVNTTDWDSKMDFWAAVIVGGCRHRASVRVSLQELNRTLRRKERSPLGLETVLRSMARCGTIQRESDFAASVDCGWLYWGVGLLLVKPLKWTFSSLVGSHHRVPLDASFVVMELVKEKASELLEVYRSGGFASRSVLSFQELRTLSSDVCADESTLCVVLLQLQRDKQIVKFCQAGQNSVCPVSDVDLGIYQLQRSEVLLGERVDKLGLEADKFKEEARTHLREGKKSQALRSLRACKRVERRSDSLFVQLESIRGILDRIAQSQTDQMVMQAYQAGVSALRLSLKDVTVERAESLVDQIQELCDTQDEVNQTLSSGVTSADTDELEEELKSLLDESKPDSISSYPEVPTSRLRIPGEPSAAGTDALSSLPAVPYGPLDVTAEQLEEELKQLTLTDLDFQQKKMTSPAKRCEPAQ